MIAVIAVMARRPPLKEIQGWPAAEGAGFE
jgi:hypothetical protein